jgi:hypothetical protein
MELTMTVLDEIQRKQKEKMKKSKLCAKCEMVDIMSNENAMLKNKISSIEFMNNELLKYISGVNND